MGKKRSRKKTKKTKVPQQTAKQYARFLRHQAVALRMIEKRNANTDRDRTST